jgi:hypothetical protein
MTTRRVTRKERNIEFQKSGVRTRVNAEMSPPAGKNVGVELRDWETGSSAVLIIQ